eukprot:TRINITY_DN8799_c0_g1_i1.p1 TRINITY_DN8799_c0_g1~~TRINITY_DN8799_c0_g1_i1.p1  ORF type:complete len:340 (-),score=180.82 TRINITY_DN8799_c0_g1_i1:370-1389(-)
MSSEDERFDGILMNIAQQSGSIDGILDSFFGFLQRKTDFFTGAQDEATAEAMVMKYYKKHWKVGQKRRAENAERNRLADEERKKKAEEKKKKDQEEYEKQQAEKAKAAASSKIEEITEEEAEKIKAEKAGKKADDDKPADEEKKDDEEEDSKEPPPTGNGGKTDKYTWTQTLQALEVFVDIKPGTKAKQVICDIGGETLKVGIKGDPLLINGKLHSKVKPDDCMWTLIDNKIVHITFEKFDNMKWWNCVVEGDPGIDTKKIVPENSKLSDLDGETRMTVEKMMYDQRQKALGKPTSDQEKQHDMLQKFMSAHPEMDFSKAKINYGGGGGGGGGGFNFGS